MAANIRTPHSDHDGRLMQTGRRVGHHGLVNAPVCAGIGDARVEQVLSIMHVEDRIAEVRFGLVARRQPDGDVARHVEEGALHIRPVDQGSRNAGASGIGEIGLGRSLEVDDRRLYAIVLTSHHPVAEVWKHGPRRPCALAVPAPAGQLELQLEAVGQGERRGARAALAVHEPAIGPPGPESLHIGGQIDGAGIVRHGRHDGDGDRFGGRLLARRRRRNGFRLTGSEGGGERRRKAGRAGAHRDRLYCAAKRIATPPLAARSKFSVSAAVTVRRSTT